MYTIAYLADRTQFICWFNENWNFCLWTAHICISTHCQL